VTSTKHDFGDDESECPFGADADPREWLRSFVGGAA
jgi:hypothetical protein